MMTSLAVSLFLENLATLIFSAQAKAFTLPDFLSTSFQFGGVYITYLNIITFGVTILCVLAVTLLIEKTRIGMAMRACSDNIGATELMGININTVVTIAFIIGAVLAAVAGILYSGEYTSFSGYGVYDWHQGIHRGGDRRNWKLERFDGRRISAWHFGNDVCRLPAVWNYELPHCIYFLDSDCRFARSAKRYSWKSDEKRS